MAEADFTGTTKANEAQAAWEQFDASYHGVQTLVDAIDCIASSHLDLTVQEVENDPSRWAPLFQEQISNIYNLAGLIGKTLEKDLWSAAVAIRLAGKYPTTLTN